MCLSHPVAVAGLVVLRAGMILVALGLGLRRLTSEPDAKTERFASQADAEPERYPKAVNE